MNTASTTETFFESLYQANPDPWGFATSEYEVQRYNATIRALGDRRFLRAFEPGCSIGELTARLTKQCAQVEALDISRTAVQEARVRCASTGARINQGSLPADVPFGTFDLVMFSEIGYYFEEQVLECVLGQLISRLVAGGIFLGVHWTGHSIDHVLSGDRVHEIIRSQPGLALDLSGRHDGFLLERWERM